MKKVIYSILAVTAFAFGSCSTQKGPALAQRTAAKWFEKGEWSNGLQLKVYSDVNKLEFYKQYQANPELWKKAFAYLRDNDLPNLPNGKVPIQGDDLFASITEPKELPLEQTKWESHRKYIDLQYIAKGKEKMLVADTSKLKIVSPYAEARDVANYTGEGREYIAEPGTYYLFFPQDGHRPTVKVPGYDSAKKVVLKIAVAK